MTRTAPMKPDWSCDWSCCIIRIMKVMNASEFKAKCLKILDKLEPPGIVIVKRGKPVARVVPVSDTKPIQLAGSMKGKIKIKGDILSTGAKWNAQS